MGISIVEPRAGFEPATCRFLEDHVRGGRFPVSGDFIYQAEPPRLQDSNAKPSGLKLYSLRWFRSRILRDQYSGS
jgi:hypothetical protein